MCVTCLAQCLCIRIPPLFIWFFFWFFFHPPLSLLNYTVAPGTAIVRDVLKRREVELNLESRVGKYTVVNANTPLSQRGGYFCETCDCLLKDSITYLDHINGKKRTCVPPGGWHLSRALLVDMRCMWGGWSGLLMCRPTGLGHVHACRAVVALASSRAVRNAQAQT
jgi:hypothetical protein